MMNLFIRATAVPAPTASSIAVMLLIYEAEIVVFMIKGHPVSCIEPTRSICYCIIEPCLVLSDAVMVVMGTAAHQVREGVAVCVAVCRAV